MMYAERESSQYCVQFAEDDLKWMSQTQVEDAYRLKLIDQSTMVYEKSRRSWRLLRETNALRRRAKEASYHVEIVPGEVKYLTLEQIRDALRTHVIDASTQVYCPAARKWRPLEKVVEGVAVAEPEEWFHVEVAPGEVKCLTLDQLDDLYRLDVVDESTMIWKEGYGTWQTLGDLLGGGDPGGPAPEGPSEEFYVELAPGEVKCLNLEQLDDAYRLDVISDSTMVWRPGFASWHTLAEVAGLASTSAPAHPQHRLSLSLEALQEPPRVSPWFGRLLVFVACAVGVVAAYRNDVLYDLAVSIDQEAEFLRLESQTIGAPGVDTPRGLSAHLGSVTARHGLDQLSHTKPVPPPEEPASEPADEATAGEDAKDADHAEAKEAEEAEEAAAVGQQKAAKKSVQNAADNRKPSNAPKRSVRSRSKSKKSEPPKDNSTMMGGDPYDPLNGKL